MCHIHVEAPMVTNWFPNFLRTSFFFQFNTKRIIVLLFSSYNNLLRFKRKNLLVRRNKWNQLIAMGATTSVCHITSRKSSHIEISDWNFFQVSLSGAGTAFIQVVFFTRDSFDNLDIFYGFEFKGRVWWIFTKKFFIFAKCPSYYARLICKIPRSLFFSCLKNKFFAFSLIPMSRIICIAFYNINWYIICSIRLLVY